MSKNISSVLILSSVLALSACTSTSSILDGNSSFVGDTHELGDTHVESYGITDGALLSPEEIAAQKKAESLGRTVFYFGFDQSSISEEDKKSLISHAQYLKDSPSARVVLEGHTDERGTTEYNLALGERRALSVRRFLMSHGVGSEKMRMVSYGEELPAVIGSTEEAYSKNRRVEMRYQSR